jgi:hypothetical protein
VLLFRTDVPMVCGRRMKFSSSTASSLADASAKVPFRHHILTHSLRIAVRPWVERNLEDEEDLQGAFTIVMVPAIPGMNRHGRFGGSIKSWSFFSEGRKIVFHSGAGSDEVDIRVVGSEQGETSVHLLSREEVLHFKIEDARTPQGYSNLLLLLPNLRIAASRAEMCAESNKQSISKLHIPLTQPLSPLLLYSLCRAFSSTPGP